MSFPAWDSPVTVSEVHQALELAAIIFFAALVILEFFAHLETLHKKLFERVGLACFGIAVLMELCAYPYGKRNDELAAKEIAHLNRDAESARAIVKAFESQIAIANARAKTAEAQVESAKAMAEDARSMAKGFEAEIAESKRETAKAQLDLAKIQERMADRKLSDAQSAEISTAIRPFSGQEFDITPYWDLPESLAIANRIVAALVAGGWKYVPPEKSGFMLGGISGVQVWTHPAADGKVKRAAESLLTALNRTGIVSVARTQNQANPPDSKLHLNVGSKP